MNLSSFIVVDRTMRPLSFTYTEYPDAVFGYVASGNRGFSPEERKAARELCESTFGRGGLDWGDDGRRWFLSPTDCVVSFVSETDRLMFVTAFLGSTGV